MINRSSDKVIVNNKSEYFNLSDNKTYKTKDNYKLDKKNIKIITLDKSNAIIGNKKEDLKM